MQAKQFHSWLKTFAEQALLNNERRLVVLSGCESWALSFLSNSVFFPEKDLTNANKTCLIYGDSKIFPANVSAKRFRDKLGSESDNVIFADSEFRIDAFAALSGTLKAGGIFFVVIADLEAKKAQSQFVSRFFNLFDMMTEHALIVEGNQAQADIVTTEIKPTSQLTKGISDLAYSCATSEQVQAVKAVEKVANGHRKRPLVLTADRGRGKSSALAIACAQLMLNARADNKLHIIITAPDSQSLAVFFSQLSTSLPEVIRRENSFLYADNCVEFIPVDQLIKHQPKASLLLVDEAAAIPVYLLEQLLHIYHRMVFSSTVHGYEGAGRGFTLKFQQSLADICLNWQALHIREPIRWRQGDPLEQFVFDTCLLNSELKSIEQQDHLAVEMSDLPSLACTVLTPLDLLADESLLIQVFSILVTAHYQTKPSDVKLLLDNPNVQLLCLIKTNKTTKIDTVVAVALLLKEGCVDNIDAVINSQRRLKNQFLPQSLLTHCGFEQAFNYSYLRIMRIAVHPEIQQQGIGRHLLRQVEKLAARQKIDFIGASFGVNAALLSFWLSAGTQVTRIGFTKDKASGEHSALVLKAINSNVTAQLKLLNDDFFRSFDFLLADEYKELDANLVLLLLKQQNRTKLATLAKSDLTNAHAFAKGQRLYSSCAYSLYIWLKHHLSANKDIVVEPVLLALISRLLQKHSTEELCRQYAYTGKKMLEQSLKNYVGQQLAAIAKEEQ